MFIDSEDLLSEIRESSIKNLIESLSGLYRIWRFTTLPFIAKFPVMFQPILFNRFKIEESSIGFIYETPIILNDDGDYTHEIYNQIYDFHLENPKLTCYGVYKQIDDEHIIIEYEDYLGCVDIKCLIKNDGIEYISKEVVDRIPILNYSSSPN
jgi:hypothetical protein